MAKAHLLILLCLLVFNPGLKAQDQIYKKDNTRLLVKVLEVGPEAIKYKLTANPDGPVYTESKINVAFILFENGRYEVINPADAQTPATTTIVTSTSINDIIDPPMSRADSLIYYKHANNLALNFLTFFNNEIGIIYQREFFQNQFNIIVPLAIGLEKPEVTQNTYFSGSQNTGSGSGFRLDRKLFEAGFGINYYPSLRSNVNYFIGPVFRYMQYEGSHYANFYDATTQTNLRLQQSARLSRYCMSVTNGFVLRTRSRLTVTLLGSLGFKKDTAGNPIRNPGSGADMDTFNSNFSLYFWTGFNVGFNF